MNRRSFLASLPLAAVAAKLKPLVVEEGHRLSTDFSLDAGTICGAIVMSDGEGEVFWTSFDGEPMARLDEGGFTVDCSVNKDGVFILEEIERE
jgi:hypothetical protein